jgi:hypothetical protein
MLIELAWARRLDTFGQSFPSVQYRIVECSHERYRSIIVHWVTIARIIGTIEPSGSLYTRVKDDADNTEENKGRQMNRKWRWRKIVSFLSSISAISLLACLSLFRRFSLPMLSPLFFVYLLLSHRSKLQVLIV